MKYLILLSLLLSSCAHTSYEKMPTVADKLDDSNGEVTDGMAITQKGAVLDITAKEVQAQKKELQNDLHIKEQRIKYLEERNAELMSQIRVLRTEMGFNEEGSIPATPAIREPASN